VLILEKKKQITLDLREWSIVIEMLQVLIINKSYSIFSELHEEKIQSVLDKFKQAK
jgi:hypothetical protein